LANLLEKGEDGFLAIVFIKLESKQDSLFLIVLYLDVLLESQ